MALAIERYLKDFSQPERVVLSVETPTATTGVTREAIVLPPETVEMAQAPAIDLDSVRAEAFELGRQEAALAHDTKHSAVVEELRSLHVDELNALRTEYEQGVSTLIAERYDILAAELIETIGAQVTRVLAPVMEKAMSDRMIEQLVVLLGEAFEEPEVSRITASGAPSLCEELKRALKDKSARLKFVENDVFDLNVSIDDAILSTRLSEWAGRLREVLA